TSGADTWTGSAAAITYNGMDGNDTINGMGGNDTIDGGAGADVATLNGAMANYTWSFDANGVLTLTDGQGTDGTDTISNVETLTFSDATIMVASTAPQSQVNTTTATAGADMGTPEHSGITMLDDGGYIVYWTITRVAGGDTDMLAQRFDAIGQKVGTEFQINDAAATNAASNQSNFAAHFTSLNNGGFATVYSSVDQAGAGTGADVVLRLFGMTTTTTTPGAEILVNTTTANGQVNPEVVQLSNGDLLVVWQTTESDGAHFDIVGQRLNSSGTKLGGEFTINQTGVNTGLNSSRLPDITALKDGGFAVVWDDDGTDGNGNASMLRIFDANGTGGSQIVANTTTTSWQEYPHVAQLGNGNIVVTWHGTVSGGSGYDVAAQVFDASGNKLGGEILVNATTASSQSGPQISALDGGGFVVVWHSDQNGNSDVYAQRFDANGAKLGTEFLVNSTSSTTQISASVTDTYDGGFIVTWSDHATLADGRGDIYSKRFDSAGNEIGYTKLTGNAADNTFNLAAAQKGIDIDGGAGTDSVVLAGTSADKNIIKITNVESITGAASEDIVLMGSTLDGTQTIDLGAGKDAVKLADGVNANSFTNVEEVIGGTGNDDITILTTFVAADKAWFSGEGGTGDTLTLTAGNDYFLADGFETINGGTGTDTLAFEDGGDIQGVALNGIENIVIDYDNTTSSTLNVSATIGFAVGTTITGGNDSLSSTGSMDLTNVTLSGISNIWIDSDSATANDAGAVLTLNATALPSGINIYGSGDDTIQMGSTSLDLSTVTTLSGISSIKGTTGNDTIIGSASADTISADLGADILTGGAGADTFKYTSAADSAFGAGDTLTDFATTVDKIDISSLAVGSFTLGSIGAASGFTVQAAQTGTMLQFDTNDDGVADMEIDVGAITVAVGDFITA
ncbi:MAG: hypothetical protein NUV50_12215, partial [Rhodospirillales bacterium]|nr:hypothetical protein [Rhodospirillales bacterium]